MDSWVGPALLSFDEPEWTRNVRECEGVRVHGGCVAGLKTREANGLFGICPIAHGHSGCNSVIIKHWESVGKEQATIGIIDIVNSRAPLPRS